MAYRILKSGGKIIKSSAYVKPFSPLDIAGLTLWLDPSGLLNNTNNSYGNVASNGSVSQLSDMTGKYPTDPARYVGATQSTSAYQPKVKFSGYGINLPILRMEWNSWMTFHEQVGIRTVFFICKHDTANSANIAAFFGHYSGLDFHGNTGNLMYSTIWTSPSIINGQGYVNGVYTAPASIYKSTSYKIISLITTGGVNMSYLSKDRTYTNRNFDGLYGEILAYNRDVTNDERLALENYLNAKWQIY